MYRIIYQCQVHSNEKTTTHQICDNSKIGSFDLVKNSFAAEPETHRETEVRSDIHVPLCKASFEFVWLRFPTRYEAREVGLYGFKLVNVILSLLVCDLPRVVVAAGLSLDLVGCCSRGHRSYRRAVLQDDERQRKCFISFITK